LKKLCRELPEEMRLTITVNYGKFLWKISGDIVSDGESMLFYETFKNLAERPEMEVRQACAFNFPAIVKSMGVAKYAVHLHATFDKLVQDKEIAVRRTMAAGFHEIALLLGVERTATHLRAPFMKLCGDTCVDVAEVFVKQLDTLLKRFYILKEEDRVKLYSDFVPNLLILTATIETRWRLQYLMVQHITMFPQYFIINEIFDHFVPVLFKIMHTGAHEVKLEASKALCVLIRRNKYNFQRQELAQRLIREFARGRGFSLRLLFLDACQHLLASFSRKFFKSNFLDAVLALCDDKVPNVQLKICDLLPPIKRMLFSPMDAGAMDKITLCVQSLKEDKDKGVAAAGKAVETELASIEVRSSNGPRNSPEDIRDKQLEEEELLNDESDDQDEVTEQAMRNYLASAGKAKGGLDRKPPRAQSIGGGVRRSSSFSNAKQAGMTTMTSQRRMSGANPPSSMMSSTASRNTVSGGGQVSGRARRYSFEGKKEAVPPAVPGRRKSDMPFGAVGGARARSESTSSMNPTEKKPISAGRRRGISQSGMR